MEQIEELHPNEKAELVYQVWNQLVDSGWQPPLSPSHAASIGVTIEEADQTIEDAIAAVRHERQLPDHVTFLLWSDSGDGRLADPFSTG